MRMVLEMIPNKLMMNNIGDQPQKKNNKLELELKYIFRFREKDMEYVYDCNGLVRSWGICCCYGLSFMSS